MASGPEALTPSQLARDAALERAWLEFRRTYKPIFDLLRQAERMAREAHDTDLAGGIADTIADREPDAARACCSVSLDPDYTWEDVVK